MSGLSPCQFEAVFQYPYNHCVLFMVRGLSPDFFDRLAEPRLIHSPFRLEALMTGHHRVISAFW
jgi:hypothetical protein